jgi:hypothetical protein
VASILLPARCLLSTRRCYTFVVWLGFLFVFDVFCTACQALRLVVFRLFVSSRFRGTWLVRCVDIYSATRFSLLLNLSSVGVFVSSRSVHTVGAISMC